MREGSVGLSVSLTFLGILVVFLGLGGDAPPSSGSLEPKWARVNWEAEAKDVDVVVMHHTAGKPGMTWEALSKLERSRLYEPRFRSAAKDPNLLGLSVQSGHFRIVDGRKVEHFCTYHWIVRTDGTAERLLWDDERGWHAGDWAVNMRSIGIVLDGDFEVGDPPWEMIQTCARLIKSYQGIAGKPLAIFGHKDVKPTKCPGAWWERGKSVLPRLVPDAEVYPINASAP